MINKRFLLMSACLTATALGGGSFAENWPMHQHDIARSGVTAEQVDLPLSEVWVYRSRHEPRPAWPDPAKQDFWNGTKDIRPLITFDRAFQVVAADGALYFGSSADHKVYSLDAQTGRERWSFFTDGAIRLAPTVANGKVYVGSDDGWVYCLDSTDGSLVWKYRPTEADRRIPGNGQITSMLPIRTDILVDEGIVYFCAGIFPSQLVYSCALNAEDGTVIWKSKEDEISPQGYLLASQTRLYVPTGRTTPAILDRSTGKNLGSLEGQGGAYALLAGDSVLSGPGLRVGQLDLSDTETKESFASFDGLRLIVHKGLAYMQSEEEISALNRDRYITLAREHHELDKQMRSVRDDWKRIRYSTDSPEGQKMSQQMQELTDATQRLAQEMRDCLLWKRPSRCPYSLILSGQVLVAGGDGEVEAFSATDGAQLWKGEVPGKVYGLAVSDGNLFVSTDRGHIHCFRKEVVDREYVVAPFTKPNPYPRDGLTDLYERAAEQIIAETWPNDEPRKGYCLVLDCGEGRLAYELAKKTDLTIVGVEEDPAKVAASRRILDDAGLYGVRVTVIGGTPSNLPLGNYFANLIISDGVLAGRGLPYSPSQVERFLRPHGGVLCIGQPEGAEGRMQAVGIDQWLAGTGLTDIKISNEGGLWGILRRGALPGSGEWTQLYANTNHTACSMDQVSGPLTIQWFGEPGPRKIIDRHHRPMSSLFKNGRIFVPADDLVIAVDAYNGTKLWELDVPNSRRVGALKNSGQMLVCDDYLYVAVEDKCWAVDVVSGLPEIVLEAAQTGGEIRDWGYINQVGDWLYGSGQRRRASFDKLGKDLVNVLEGDFRPVILANHLFAVHRHTGEKKWTYENGAIVNSAITIGEGRIYFAENRNPAAIANERGRLPVSDFCASDTFFVALDLETGEKVWEHPLSLPFEHIMFLNLAEKTLLFAGSYNREEHVYYGLHTFHSDTGEPKWNKEYLALDIRGKKPAPTEGSHGEQWQHPIILESTIFSRPYAFDLHTGEQKDYIAYRGGHGCGGLTASAHFLYGRGGNPRMYPVDVTETEGIRLTHSTRPGCWLNIIPAGGLVLIPESSSGCTCAFSLQTSIAFVPKADAGALVE